SGDLNAGHVVTLSVNMSEAVTVAGGTPTLSLNNGGTASYTGRSEEHTPELQSRGHVVCRPLLVKETSFNLNGATLQDASRNIAKLSGAVPTPLCSLQF